MDNTVYTDSWPGYNFLNRNDSGYIHNIVIGIFGLITNEVKTIIKKLYNYIHGFNFGFFLREVEYRRSIYNLNNREKLDDFDLLFQVNVQKI